MNSKLLELFDAQMSGLIAAEYNGEDSLSESISYALSSKGKRVRPLLCMLCCKAVGGNVDHSLRAALAIEMVHTYSLIHDDLPCMDNDQLRRGIPTCHAKFGEGAALLAGDGLLTDAFSIISDPSFFSDLDFVYNGEIISRLVCSLSTAAGSKGMVLGQSEDVFWTSKNGSTAEDLHQIHIKKTGQLIGASCAAGAICAGAGDETVSKVRTFGIILGHAFQILDDVLDDCDGIGKSPGKDGEMGKLTYLSYMTADAARDEAGRLTSEAVSLIKSLTGFAADDLERFANELLSRGC